MKLEAQTMNVMSFVIVHRYIPPIDFILVLL